MLALAVKCVKECDCICKVQCFVASYELLDVVNCNTVHLC